MILILVACQSACLVLHLCCSSSTCWQWPRASGVRCIDVAPMHFSTKSEAMPAAHKMHILLTLIMLTLTADVRFVYNHVVLGMRGAMV